MKEILYKIKMITDIMIKNQLHPAIEEHLRGHGLVTDEELEQFLNPMLKDLPSPFLIKDMAKAAGLVMEAIMNGWDIIIWGDYDVDGITAAALLILFFRKLNIEVHSHIPNRLTEGYGLNKPLIRKMSEQSDNKKLLITVDCGISNLDEVRYAQSLGFKVIVTDHHNLPEIPPEADATLNPKQSACRFPFKELSGVGVAFYLAAAIRSKARDKKHLFSVSSSINMKSFMSLVMLGTIADVVPLTSVNRILAKAGAASLVSSPIGGISSLLDELGISGNSLTSETIAFQVAPVINAAGRLGEPDIALNALISEGEEARTFSKKLISMNKKRKMIGRNDLETAIAICRPAAFPEALKSLVIKGPFHDGLLGITASRLVEKYNVPVLVCCEDESSGQQLKGSARAPENFNLYNVIRSCSRFLIRYGGHQAAAGFSLKTEHFDEFRKAINNSAQLEYLNNVNNNIMLNKNIVKLTVSEAFNPDLLTNLSQLEPLGEGNPKPIFRDDQVSFVSMKHFGLNKEHVRGMMRGKYNNIPFIGFNMGSRLNSTIETNRFSLDYSLMLDTYNNGNSWKLRVENVWQ